MKIKRIIAADMRGAMRQVRQIFGDDAVILSNRSCPEGVEVIAAMDFDEQAIRLAASRQMPHRVSGPSQKSSPSAPQPSAPAPQKSVEQPEAKVQAAAVAARAQTDAVSNPVPVVPAMATTADVLKARYERQEERAASSSPEQPKAATEIASEHRESDVSAEATQQDAFADALAQFQDRPAAAAQDAQPRTSAERPVSASLQAAAKSSDWSWLIEENDANENRLSGLQEEVGLLRELFERQLEVLEWHRYAREHPLEIETGERLQALGMPQALARGLAADAVKEQPDRALAAALRALGRQMQIADEDLVDRGGIYALVGPTGVGKTTTLAKLAARAVLRYGRESVALITTDRFRIGAQEQLRNYARILNVPLHVARDEQHLGELLAAVGDRRLVLVDTAGMSQRDFRMMSMLEKMPQIDDRLNMILVLSANAQYVTQVDTIRRFGVLPLKGMVMTKLDETVLLGGALAALVAGKLPLYCAGVGQRVPEDLWRPTAADLIRQTIELGQADMARNKEDAAAASGQRA